MKTIVSIVGARPQFVKLAPFSLELRKFYNEIIIHTGQHYDENMSRLFFDQLNIPKPDVNLSIGSGGHGQQTGEMLSKIENLLQEKKPDAVVVFGDTNSTLAGALAASKLHIPCFHIEAGLRSFNTKMPEEINRIVADHVCELLFAPTKTGMKNLKKEGLAHKAILTGDIMVDALRLMASESDKSSKVLETFGLTESSFYLLTLHRPYNVDDPILLNNILEQLNALDYQVVFPVHPRTKKNINNHYTNIVFKEPAGYLDFIALQKSALKIITDSGGIQKEAFILEKPCITLRTETEWTETVDCGWNLLINPTETNIAEKIVKFSPLGKTPNLFGKKVAFQIVLNINKYLGLKD